MTTQPTLLERIGERPTVAIKFVFWLAQVVIGFVILLPGYEPERNTPSLAAGFSTIVALKIYGVLLLVPGALGLFLMYFNNWKNSRRIRQALTFWSFLLFTFFTCIRLVSFGPAQLVWIAYALCALTMGIVHLRLKWEEQNN